MELAEIFRIFHTRWLASLAIVLVAIGAAVAVRLSVSSVPTGAATVQILVDSPDSALANLSQETVPLTTRASVFAQVMTSAAVLEDIAASAKLPASQITAQGPYSGPGQALDTITPSEARGNQLLAQTVKYRLTFVAQTNEPVVTASVQGPNPTAAARVASSIFPGVQHYVSTLQEQSSTPVQHRVTIRQLGPPQAGSVNSSARSTLMIAALLGVLLLGSLVLLGIESLRRRAADAEARAAEGLPEFEDHLPLYRQSSPTPAPDSPTPVSAGSAPGEHRR